MGILINNNGMPKPHDDYYHGFILKIAAAANVELPEATQAVYLERLRQLSGEQIKTAASRTIEEWNRPHMMPPLPFIIERCTEYQEVPQKAVSTFKQLREKSGITKAEIAEWLESGKDTQREYMAKLEADPQWQAMAQRLGAYPGLVPGRSNVPEAPEERRSWARERAVSNGWLPREAGSDDE